MLGQTPFFDSVDELQQHVSTLRLLRSLPFLFNPIAYGPFLILQHNRLVYMFKQYLGNKRTRYHQIKGVFRIEEYP